MPKKKPIDKRLNKLFTDITPEQVQSDPKNGVRERTPDPVTPSTVDNAPVAKPRESSQIVKSVAASGSSAMSLAFQTGQNSWATLQIMDAADERKWSQDEQLLVKQVADQLSLALENAQLFQETQSRAEELVVLNELGNELATKLDPKPIAEAVYKYTSRLMDTRFFFVALYDEKNFVKQFCGIPERSAGPDSLQQNYRYQFHGLYYPKQETGLCARGSGEIPGHAGY